MSVLDKVFAEPLIADEFRAHPLVYVDVGAAVGVEEPWLTLLAARDLTRVVAFEPHPDNFRGISRLPNGTYHQVAIGPEPGKASFYLDTTGSSLIDRAGEAGRPLEAIEVEVETLERMRASGKVPTLDIVKTDTELTDYESIASCGGYLDDEVLCVEGEFSFAGGGRERPFRDFDALLQPKGFVLFGLSTQLGGYGELHGGNFLYLKSVFEVLDQGDPALRRSRALKLFVIAMTLFHFDTAYVIARALGDAKAISEDEAYRLRDLALSHVYLPDAGSFAPWRVRAATVLGNAAALVGGGFSRGVSTPSSNRLENYRRLVRPMGSPSRRAKVTGLYERFYVEEARRAQERAVNG